MTTNFRTQLLLGFTVLAGALSGCIIETTSGGHPSGTCLENQFFNVRWEIDNGSTMFSCAAAPAASVRLSTTNGQILAVGRDCLDGRTCADGTPCNFSGSTDSGIPAGTIVAGASLISDTNGALLSSSEAPRLAIGACSAVELGFEFPIN